VKNADVSLLLGESAAYDSKVIFIFYAGRSFRKVTKAGKNPRR
jgi:hypothetical protein